MSDWNRFFKSPVMTPEGKSLDTLRAAADYIHTLPKSECEKVQWQVATACLIAAAKGCGLMLHARASMLQAMQSKNGSAYDADQLAKKWGGRRQ